MNKTIPKKKKCKNAKWLSEETLQIAEKRREAKGKERIQQYMNQELPGVQAQFRNGRGTRNQIVNICWITEKAREFQKSIYSALLTTPKPLTVDHNKLWKILQERKYQTSCPASWEMCVQVKKQQLEQDMRQQTGSKSGKEYIKAVYCYPAYLTSMQSTSCKMLDCI